jgi:hypothetical protein
VGGGLRYGLRGLAHFRVPGLLAYFMCIV